MYIGITFQWGGGGGGGGGGGKGCTWLSLDVPIWTCVCLLQSWLLANASMMTRHLPLWWRVNILRSDAILTHTHIIETLPTHNGESPKFIITAQCILGVV